MSYIYVGTVYNPRFITTEKGEPQRHHMLKTKQTFCLVHGLGMVHGMRFYS